MSGQPYTSTISGTFIGAPVIFNLTPGTSTFPQTIETNTSSLFPVGPYTTSVNRSVAFRITTTNANRLYY